MQDDPNNDPAQREPEQLEPVQTQPGDEPVQSQPGDEPVQDLDNGGLEDDGTPPPVEDAQTMEMTTMQATEDEVEPVEDTNDLLIVGGIILVVVALVVVTAMLIKRGKN